MAGFYNPIFHDESAARAYLESIRWPKGPVCPYCGQSVTVSAFGGNSMGPGWYQCSACRRKFTVRVGTFYERSHVPLHKWVLAMHLMSASENGVSARHIQRVLGVTYKTAWFMAHRIRAAMRHELHAALIVGADKLIKTDETRVGAKVKKRARERTRKGAVVSLIEGDGKVRPLEVADVPAKELRPAARKHPSRRQRSMTEGTGGSRRMMTLADVAAEAGVSEVTVSRVIRAQASISERTRRRVQVAIERLGYVPNRLAGSLASATSELLAVIIPSHGRSYGDVLRGVDAAVSKGGLRTVVSVTGYDPAAEFRMVKSLLSWRPAAILLVGLNHSPAACTLLRNAGTIVVELTDIDGPPIDIAVGMSHISAGRETANYLLRRGYRRFGYIGHNTDRDVRAMKRKQAFMSAIAESGGRLIGEVTTSNHPPVRAGRAALADLLSAHPSIRAVYFSEDEAAIGGVFHCMAESISIPNELAIAGFSGINMGQALPIPLTTIASNRFEMGRLAGDHIISRLNGQYVPEYTDVGFKLIEGATA